MAKSQWLLDATVEKARKAILPLLVNELVGAQRIGYRNSLTAKKPKACYGIVADWKLVKEYIEQTGRVVKPEWNTWIWAIWKPTRIEAIAAYESATEAELRPVGAGGMLTPCDPDEYEFELIDQE